MSRVNQIHHPGPLYMHLLYCLSVRNLSFQMMKRKLFAMILDVEVVGAGGGIIENFHAAKRQLSTNVRVYGLPYLVCCTVV